jgi:hypothetical protein
MQCCPLKVNGRFVGMCRLHLQGIEERTKQKISVKQIASSFFKPEDGDMFLRNDG